MSQFGRLQKGSLILVTGGTGLIGSAVVTLLLDQGYKVRIATRSVTKQRPFQDALEVKYGKESVEFIEITDFAKPESWDLMLKDVVGVQHLASDVSFSNDYESVIKGSRDMTTTFLNAVEKHTKVKSVVLTSSRIASYQPAWGQDIHVTNQDWSDFFLDLAKNAKDDDPAKGLLTYAASKVVEERTAWELIKKNKKPHFAFNVVLPDYVAGPVSNPTKGWYSTHNWLNELFNGKSDGLAAQSMQPAARFVDVRDVAALHVALMLDERSDNRRLFAAPHKFSLNGLLEVFRKVYPDRDILADLNLPKQPNIELEDEESTALLEAFLGRKWIPLEETVRANIEAA